MNPIMFIIGETHIEKVLFRRIESCNHRPPLKVYIPVTQFLLFIPLKGLS